MKQFSKLFVLVFFMMSLTFNVSSQGLQKICEEDFNKELFLPHLTATAAMGGSGIGRCFDYQIKILGVMRPNESQTVRLCPAILVTGFSNFDDVPTRAMHARGSYFGFMWSDLQKSSPLSAMNLSVGYLDLGLNCNSITLGAIYNRISPRFIGSAELGWITKESTPYLEMSGRWHVLRARRGAFVDFGMGGEYYPSIGVRPHIDIIAGLGAGGFRVSIGPLFGVTHWREGVAEKITTGFVSVGLFGVSF